MWHFFWSALQCDHSLKESIILQCLETFMIKLTATPNNFVTWFLKKKHSSLYILWPCLHVLSVCSYIFQNWLIFTISQTIWLNHLETNVISISFCLSEYICIVCKLLDSDIMSSTKSFIISSSNTGWHQCCRLSVKLIKSVLINYQ